MYFKDFEKNLYFSSYAAHPFLPYEKWVELLICKFTPGDEVEMPAMDEAYNPEQINPKHQYPLIEYNEKNSRCCFLSPGFSTG